MPARAECMWSKSKLAGYEHMHWQHTSLTLPITTSPSSGEYLHPSKVLLVRLYRSQAVQNALTKLQEGCATHTDRNAAVWH